MSGRGCVFTAITAAVAAFTATAVADTVPKDTGTFRFGIIGDSGSGDAAQLRVAEHLMEAHRYHPLELVIMLGDNIYGREDPQEYAARFEKPYRSLLDAGVPFYAALGNHDHPNQRFYREFNMEGHRYYTFKAKDESVRFFALDSNYLDPEQVGWLRQQACGASEHWKIAFFHHPIYSSGAAHGSSLELRAILEPIFEECGIDVVFSGHDHFYERIKPQHDILYFVSGAAGKLRRGNIRKSGLTAAGFDQGYHFLVAAITGDVLRFTALSDEGKVIDSGEWGGRDEDTKASKEKQP
jgi:hypothetical protein